MLSVIINITAAVILLVCLGFIAYWLVAAKQGDCEFRLLKGKKTPFKVDSMDSRRAHDHGRFRPPLHVAGAV